MQQVLLNIILNALDAMQNTQAERPRVLRLSCGDAADSPLAAAPPPGSVAAADLLYIEITDSGCGMDDATLKRIYEPFFTTKPVGVGTGMGLAMAYGAIGNHHGWIQVSSKVGEGTTFVVFLPRVQDKAKPPKAENI